MPHPRAGEVPRAYVIRGNEALTEKDIKVYDHDLKVYNDDLKVYNHNRRISIGLK